jgi:hypothetical protein
MVQYISKGDIFGRIGTGVGRGLAEQLPKEVERGRLSASLKNLGEQKGQSRFQQFAGLVGAAHEYPQVVQSGADLLRQQAIIDSVQNKQNPNNPPSVPYQRTKLPQNGGLPPSATTTGPTNATLNPYIPPNGPEQEDMARDLMAREPQVYPSIEAARQGVANQVSGNINQSNALITKRDLEDKVQNAAEQKLRDEIQTVGAQVPGTVVSRLQQKAVDDVAKGRMSADQAKITYGKEANQISQDFSNIRSWGNLAIATKDRPDLLKSMDALHRNAKKGKYQKEAANEMVAENGFTPQFAWANMFPVSDIKELNDEVKALPSLHHQFEKGPASPGLLGLVSVPKSAESKRITLEAAPGLVRAMGLEGSPLSIGYELDKRGLDSDVFKQYLLDHLEELNLSDDQKDELQKPKPGFYGWMNDWFFRSFSGVK